MAHIYSKTTVLNGVVLSKAFEKAITTDSNTYVGIGRSEDWGTRPYASESIESLADLFRQLLVLKRIGSSDVNLVVPDRLWANGTVYNQFDSDVDMYEHEEEIELTGTIDHTYGHYITTNVSSNTYFTEELEPGDIIEFENIDIGEMLVRREIVSVSNDHFATMNSELETYQTNSKFYRVESSYPRYAKKFYVRNTQNELFICLYNKENSKSTIEPNYVGDPIIDHSATDGYVWRYLYTIPIGLNQKFKFTDSEGITWIPIDTTITANTVDGAIEHIRILDGGYGYNSNTPNSVADIITIEGDGSDALYLANVILSSNTTTIYSLTSANNGSGYSYATVTANSVGGASGAQFKALIGPAGGFGADPARDLGAKFLGIVSDFTGDVSGTLPETTDIGGVEFRQVCIIRDPQYSNGVYVNSSTVAMTTNLSCAFGTTPVSIGDKFQQSTGTGYVIGKTGTSPHYFLLNNTSGTFIESQAFSVGSGSGTVVDVVYTPDIKRSGEILYVENVETTTRSSSQVEIVKLVLKF